MLFKNKKHIIFDLDGTLIDSVPDLALSINHTLKYLNKNEIPVDVIRTYVGNGAKILVDRALSNNVIISDSLDENYSNEALDIFLNFYRKNLCVNTILYDNVKNTLIQLKNKSYTLSIVTNKPYSFIEPILKSFNINELFDFCIGGDSLNTKKPNSKPLLHVCKVLGFSTLESVMIGDSKNDITAANNANMDSIALSYGYNYGEDISIYNPNIVYDKFENILKDL